MLLATHDVSTVEHPILDIYNKAREIGMKLTCKLRKMRFIFSKHINFYHHKFPFPSQIFIIIEQRSIPLYEFFKIYCSAFP